MLMVLNELWPTFFEMVQLLVLCPVEACPHRYRFQCYQLASEMLLLVVTFEQACLPLNMQGGLGSNSGQRRYTHYHPTSAMHNLASVYMGIGEYLPSIVMFAEQ